jgi:putative DNA primase/helicase
LLSISPIEDENGIIKPFTLTLTDEAKREWKDFSMVVEKEMRGGGRFENITDWASKLPGSALRIAGNFHCALNAYNQPWASPISEDTMNNALKLSAILAEHALLVFGYMGADKSLEAAKKVWSWIERNRQEQFTARDCFQALKGTYKRMDDLNPAISVLTERFYIFKQAKEDRPGRPSRTFSVHPKISEGWK